MATKGQLILKALIHHRQITKRYLSFIQERYFESPEEKAIFRAFETFVKRYGTMPTKEALEIEIEQRDDLNDKFHKDVQQEIETVWNINPGNNIEYLQNTIEEFCKDRALYLAIMESANIYDGSVPKPKNAIQSVITEALSITFDNSIGMGLEDYESVFDQLVDTSKRVEFDLTCFNIWTKNGLPPGTLTEILAGTNVGKSAIMCSMAANNVRMGKNALYITGELSEKETLHRIFANLINIPMNDIPDMGKDIFAKRMHDVFRKSPGRLKVKEYPMGSTSVFQFQALLEDLKLHDGFVPDIVYVDYLGVFLSTRANAKSGMYEGGKFVAEDLRGFAQRNKLPVVTAAQLNRGGFSSTDPDLDDTAESFAITMPADLIVIAHTTEELMKEGKMALTLRKSRMNSRTRLTRTLVGIDYDRMKLFDVEDYDMAKQISAKVADKKEEPIRRSSLRRLGSIHR